MALHTSLDALDTSSDIWYICSMPNENKTNRNIAYSCRYHLVFCPTYRRKVLVPPRDNRLKTILLETLEKWGQAFIEMEVMPDHVHLLVGRDPQCGIHRLVKYLKGTRSRILRQEFPVLQRKLLSLWIKSYCVATTGGVTPETLKRCVEARKNR
jgi:putative transposase